ncbi:MAG: DUF3237 domain-containing protein [Dehalococcoidia bacterium]
MPALIPLMTLTAELEEGQDVGKGPFGNRQIYIVKGGSFEGPRLKGEVLSGGGDWLLQGSDGAGRLDVRATLQTVDGALVYVQYYGVLVMTPQAMEAIAAGNETEFGQLHFFTQPRFETGDERYAWLNRTVAVGQGRVIPRGVHYRMFSVEND